MFKGFRDFIMRGNVIELATAVIIGGAFTAIVNAVSDNLINPIIASFGSADVSGLGFQIRSGDPSTMLDFGAVITAILNFLIVAGVVYFIIINPMNKLSELTKDDKDVDPKDPAPTTEQLLAEIRDLLKNGGQATAALDQTTSPLK
ncbi:mechanosensitive ion channel protein MscL [Corynebacterium phocae]|uniref:Large-conductance mechanosensitive channel n=1 Tax=Corynebacterium phocae TaxID=161895 RepID=A0A1L7D4H9_9CORY|nr:large conductance mechanosensitive channel protein MscL [Corynebacterium phocae]APT92967.1 mechanosensitive ion channel protein MscL [Corynebacterium phocae]KAA8723303.1 large conductance mechanosensitive channel protein MscL [Corynebacterium phocae]